MIGLERLAWYAIGAAAGAAVASAVASLQARAERRRVIAGIMEASLDDAAKYAAAFSVYGRSAHDAILDYSEQCGRR